MATITALAVWTRFSAWSKTIECSDSKTPSVLKRLEFERRARRALDLAL